MTTGRGAVGRITCLPLQKMARVSIQYYESGMETLEMVIKLKAKWLERAPQELLERFFADYAERYPAMPRVDASQYRLVDVCAKRVVGAVREVADEAILSVTRASSEESVLETVGLADAEIPDDDFERFCEAYCLYIYDRRLRTNPNLNYVRMKMRLRRLMADRDKPTERPARRSERERAGAHMVDVDEGASRQKGAPAPPVSQAKDWDRINFRKCLCPHVVAGRRCLRGAGCSYAHSFDELRVVAKPPRPGVCVEASTADHVLPLPELWQLGAFAKPKRPRRPLLERLAEIKSRDDARKESILKFFRAIRQCHDDDDDDVRDLAPCTDDEDYSPTSLGPRGTCVLRDR